MSPSEGRRPPCGGHVTTARESLIFGLVFVRTHVGCGRRNGDLDARLAIRSVTALMRSPDHPLSTIIWNRVCVNAYVLARRRNSAARRLRLLELLAIEAVAHDERPQVL